MHTEKLDIKSLTDYVMRKHKPSQVITLAPPDQELQKDTTHFIYEISGDENTKILTRVGEAKSGEKKGDYTMCIYPQYSVSGELILIKKSKVV